jgi:hypothetical protein
MSNWRFTRRLRGAVDRGVDRKQKDKRGRVAWSARTQ